MEYLTSNVVILATFGLGIPILALFLLRRWLRDPAKDTQRDTGYGGSGYDYGMEGECCGYDASGGGDSSDGGGDSGGGDGGGGGGD